MDELLQKAIERRNQLRHDLEAVERFIHDYTARQPVGRTTLSRADHVDLFSDTKAKRGERNAALVGDAEKLILAEGRPLTRFQLLDKLAGAGHEIFGGDKSKVLGTILWRSRQFYNIQGAGYWPKGVKIPSPYDTLQLRETSLS